MTPDELSFIEAMGRSFAEIRDRRLYRGTAATFDEYCRARWKMSEAEAEKLIRIAQAMDGLR